MSTPQRSNPPNSNPNPSSPLSQPQSFGHPTLRSSEGWECESLIQPLSSRAERSEPRDLHLSFRRHPHTTKNGCPRYTSEAKRRKGAWEATTSSLPFSLHSQTWMPHPCAARVGNRSSCALNQPRKMGAPGLDFETWETTNLIRATRNASLRETTKIAQGASPGKRHPNHPPPRRGGTTHTKKQGPKPLRLPPQTSTNPSPFAHNYPAPAHNHRAVKTSRDLV
jgi:hypothetical protein